LQFSVEFWITESEKKMTRAKAQSTPSFPKSPSFPFLKGG
jgi:hypothetical protein